MYIYPNNLKEKSKFLFWSLKDLTIILIGSILSVIILVLTDFLLPLICITMYGFLTITTENEVTIADYIRFAFKFFIKKQQLFLWRCIDENKK